MTRALGVDPAFGLEPREVVRRAHRIGVNRLREPPPRSAWRIGLGQFRSLVAALLAAAAAASYVSARAVEGNSILAVLLINALIGFATELRAARSMEALRRLTRTTAKVRRGGVLREIAAEELVPGDVVALEGGDIVSADLRLLEASRLEVDESMLTGESAPVAKSIPPVAAEAPLAERTGALWSGTAVTRGSGLGVVVATGERTALGGVAELAAAAAPPQTPLERQLARLAGRLIGVTLAVAAATVALGVARGRDLREMVEIGVALAVAAIPEGLPIVATLALARGVWRMAQRQVLVRRLSAVASLGAATVILTDKTGTLTENRMTAVRLALARREVGIEGPGLEAADRFRADGAALVAAREPELRAALEIAALCNNASAGDGGAVGDPLEVALLVAAAKGGIRRAELLARWPELGEEAFDPALRAMATRHADGAGCRVAVKGALESVLAACTRERHGDEAFDLTAERRADWLSRGHRLAAGGLRVLALAEKRLATPAGPVYRDLELVALVGLLDPPRLDVRPSLAACRRAGIRVVMVTGDQAGTALAVARDLALVAAGEDTLIEGRELPAGEPTAAERARLVAVPLFARVEPEQKLRLIRWHQQQGAVVAMLGDGVNDAPALRQADVGVAMGRRGTQVAREAADLVLQDDSFASIVGAVRQGRVILANLRRFALYLLSCNASEIVLVAGAVAIGTPLPLLPLQILYLNLVTDVFPALALGFGEGDPQVMRRPPAAAGQPILAARHWRRIAGYAALLAAAVLAALLVALHLLGWSERRAGTVAFVALALAQLGHVFDMRGRDSRPLANDVVRNPWIWSALVLCLALVAAAVELPTLASLLGAEPPGAAGWGLAAATALLPLAVTQASFAVATWRRRRAPRPVHPTGWCRPPGAGLP